MPGLPFTDIIKHGRTSENKQRYLCQNPECLRCTFILDYTYFGRTKEVKQQIVEMSLNSSGTRDIARVLEVGTPTVIRELKTKKPYLKCVNEKALESLRSEQVEVEIYKVEDTEEVEEAGVEESELDEM